MKKVRTLIVAGSAAMLMVLISGSAQAGHTNYGPAAACSPDTLRTWHNASEWNSAPPACYGTWRQTSIPADSTPDLKRRSESKYSADGTDATARAAAGQTTRMTGAVIPRLGAAAKTPRNWHAVAQLIGPEYDGTWAGAPVSVVVRDGRWFVENGLRKWSINVGPYVDGKMVNVDVNVKLSEDPTVGRVWGTIGGMAFDERHATFWHRHVYWSNGIYRGSGNTSFALGGSQPTYRQDVFWRVKSVVNAWPQAPVR